MALLSEPAPGSVMAIAPHFGSPSVNFFRKRTRCAGVPAESTAAPPSIGCGRQRYCPASPQLSCSIIMMKFTMP